uniref:ABC transporter permease n=1 Tax=Nonomuraea pusilla TaxID=46177 RepID=UPI0006E3596E|nr:FtsX-like permease family protein [Nonomuraea pusilla]
MDELDVRIIVLRVSLASLRHSWRRAFFLGLGILVASSSFLLLTAAVRTSRLETIGLVQENGRSAYDVLVRPKGSQSALEKKRSLVQANYLSGIFGGITLDQYHALKRLSGIDVAAPVANLGYMLVDGQLSIDVTPFLTKAPRQLFRLKPTYVVGSGLRSYSEQDLYLYVTESPLREDRNIPALKPSSRLVESGKYQVCWYFNQNPSGGDNKPTDRTLNPFRVLSQATSPFDAKIRSTMTCQSLNGGATSSRPAVLEIPVTYPVLLSAIDPEQEDRLVGLSGARVAGRALTGNDTVKATVDPTFPDIVDLKVPVQLSARSPVDGTITAEVERLEIGSPDAVPAKLGSPSARRWVEQLTGEVVGRQKVSITQGYPRVDNSTARQWRSQYWTVGPVSYQESGQKLTLTTQAAQDPAVWSVGKIDKTWETAVPIENTGVQSRTVTRNGHDSDSTARRWKDTKGIPFPSVELVGAFDPQRLKGFSSLTQVPLETYRTPNVDGADEASRKALGGQPLTPDRNLGGYLAQPPGLLTTLGAIDAFTKTRVDRNTIQERAPISAIRIRVAEVEGVDEVSRARVNAVATKIRRIFPDLDVDVTMGSSPAPQTVELPPGVGVDGMAIRVNEYWVKKGVALQLVSSVDRKSLMLNLLVLTVCGLFLAQAAFASVRARRQEIATLRCLGWSKGRVFLLISSELVVVASIAGVAGAVLSPLIGSFFGVEPSWTRSVSVVPLAWGLAVLSGAFPAWRAARMTPIEALTPPVSPSGSGRSIRSVGGLAIANLRRVPGRTTMGALGLALGVAAVTILLAITFAFRGEVIGSLLGDAVVAQARTVDYIAIGLTVLLGAAGALDLLLISLRERAGELAALRALGWSRGHLVRLASLEGAGIGVFGGVLGATAGILVVWSFSGAVPGDALVVAGVSGVAGFILLMVMLALPVWRFARLEPAVALSGE